jgi:predicted DNA-binding transcriptional regulator YafY
VLQLEFVAEGAARGALLGFGADLEVLSPESLRRSLAETAREVLGLYGPGPGPAEAEAGRPTL